MSSTLPRRAAPRSAGPRPGHLELDPFPPPLLPWDGERADDRTDHPGGTGRATGTSLRSPFDGSPTAEWGELRSRRAALEAERVAAQVSRPRRFALPGGRLELNAIALMLTTVATAGMGLVFWTAAARFYPAAQVGVGSAMISTLTLLATLAQFNLGNVYARFLHRAGRSSRRFVFGGYAAVVVAGLLLGVAFQALGLGDGIFTSEASRLWFPCFIAVLAVFALQDFVLVAMQKARIVPVENVIFSVVKVVLLVVLATRMPGMGIAVAWVVPAAVAVVLVSFLVLLRGLPSARTPGVAPGTLPSRRAFGGIVAGEYLSGAVGIVVPMMLPLLVLWRLGAEANAFFAIPWLIASSLNLLIWNVASSLLVEAASEPDRAPALIKRALRLTLLVGGLGSVVELAGAPIILGIVGGQYAEHGTDLLRVMALVVPFNAVLVAWTTMMRIQNRMILLVTQQILCGAAVLGIAVALLPSLDVTGAGVAYVVAQGSSAVLVAVPLLRYLKRSTERV